MRTIMNLKEILAKNVNALMARNEALNSNAKLAKHCKRLIKNVSPRAIGYLRDTRDSRQPKLDTIEAVAHAFKISPWMLLTPDFDAHTKTGGKLPPPEIIALAERIHANRDTMMEVFRTDAVTDEEMEANGWKAGAKHTVVAEDRAKYAPPRQRTMKLKR